MIILRYYEIPSTYFATYLAVFSVYMIIKNLIGLIKGT